jgi:glycine dehydrogenase subunit 1
LNLALDRDTSCFILQSPNFLGLIEDLGQAKGAVKEVEALLVAVVNPLSLAILKAPAEAGADIVCGDGQVLGGGLSLGSSCFGFLATKNQYLRQMPGRVVGKTTDKDGHQAYCLTLQAREQHIRREKATSNICSNQSLNAIAATVYLSLLGKDGLQNAASYSFSNTQYLYQRMKEVRGINVPYPPKIFNEFIWEPQDQALNLMDKLYQKNIIAGYWLGRRYPEYKNSILSCCTEKKTKQDIDNFVNTLGHILHG